MIWFVWGVLNTFFLWGCVCVCVNWLHVWERVGWYDNCLNLFWFVLVEVSWVRFGSMAHQLIKGLLSRVAWCGPCIFRCAGLVDFVSFFNNMPCVNKSTNDASSGFAVSTW